MNQIGTNGKKVQRLLQRIRDECGIDIPADTRLCRTYAGHWQLAAGSWKWCLWPNHCIGSQHTVTELLKAERIEIYMPPGCSGDVEIIDPSV